MPAAFILVAVVVIASYIFSPPPIASRDSLDSSRSVSGRGDSWAGCGVPSHPTYQDWLDCQEWRKEKYERRDAEERAP